MAVLMEALERAFDRFGGVPEELLFAQMRAVVLSDDRAGGGALVLNAEFLGFAAHWGFMPRSCRPYRARTKGKVEARSPHPGELLLRPLVRERRRSQRAGRRLAGGYNQRSPACHDAGAPRRPLRARRAGGASPTGPYRRLGLRQAPEPGPRRRPPAVEVERRPLSVYAEALQ